MQQLSPVILKLEVPAENNTKFNLNSIHNPVLMNTENSYLGKEELPLFAPTSDEKTMALLSHVLTLVAGFIAPLVIYLIKKEESSFVTAHAKESLNFQITVLILLIISGVLMIILIGILLIWALSIANLVLVIVATIKASENKMYRYPFNFRLIK